MYFERIALRYFVAASGFVEQDTLMNEKQFRVYGYRWVVLALFMLINVTIQIMWISDAPITGPAMQFYDVGDLQIGLLAMTFMIAFSPMSLPVAQPFLLNARTKAAAR